MKLDESGGALLMGLVFMAVVVGLGMYFYERNARMQRDLFDLNVKTQAVNDRDVLRHQLVNFALPDPT